MRRHSHQSAVLRFLAGLKMPLLASIVVALVGSGCAARLADRQYVPEKLVSVAQPVGLPTVRVWGDDTHSTYWQFARTEAQAMRSRFQQRQRRDGTVMSHILAISGGADDGAFGAGFLVGWGERGDRPDFDIVTGVSAGALIAPFVFLGGTYDRQLTELFTRLGPDQIYQADVLGGLLGGPALASSRPLEELIERYVDREMMRRLAAERRKGRVLLVGTTNIDAERPVYWDAGRIAQQGSDRALATLRKVLLASASIPGVFPPVRIAVTANGQTYDELHVDGGATREVFFSPSDFNFGELDREIGIGITRRLWVIRNGKIVPEWQAVPESSFAIGQRSLASVLKNQTIGDLIRMHDKARAEGIDYNLAVIPGDFKAPRPKPFDRSYMMPLYERGYQLARKGYAWIKAPPGVIFSSAR